MFRNWGWCRDYRTGRIRGFGFLGCESFNESCFFVEWDLLQIHGHVRSTKYTRAFRYGIGLAPARAWFSVNADKPGKSCGGIHIYLPFASWSHVPFWRSHYPLGRFRFNTYPQNNNW